MGAMTGERASGVQGEKVALQLLLYAGWDLIERQYLIHGHRVDYRMKHPQYGETLVEVKVWATVSGRDTVKKAIADAYDLQQTGDALPYVLVLSHDLAGLLSAMLRRAIAAGAIRDVLVLTLVPFGAA